MEKFEVPFTYDDLVNNIRNKINFSFSRFGDGEWNCIFNKKGSNCDGHTYFTDLGLSLKSVVESSPKYNVGLQNLGYTLWKDEIDKIPNIKFSDSDILHKASIKGLLPSLFESLNNRDIILVGPKYLSNLDRIKVKHHIIIPKHNCWVERMSVESSIRSMVKDNDVIIYSASMMSNVIIDSLYNDYTNTITQIDCGSVFDPYVGLITRRYHENIINNL